MQAEAKTDRSAEHTCRTRSEIGWVLHVTQWTSRASKNKASRMCCHVVRLLSVKITARLST